MNLTDSQIRDLAKRTPFSPIDIKSVSISLNKISRDQDELMLLIHLSTDLTLAMNESLTEASFFILRTVSELRRGERS